MRATELLKRCGYWRIVQTTMATVVVCLVAALVAELAIPIRPLPPADDMLTAGVEPVDHLPSDPNQLYAIDSATVLRAIRQGVFRSATPVRDRPLADKTIERIRSQLSLQCIMEMNGEPVAYIQVTGLGLKKCRIGDVVEDLFTVLDIRKKTVEISIIDHRVSLSL